MRLTWQECRYLRIGREDSQDSELWPPPGFADYGGKFDLADGAGDSDFRKGVDQVGAGFDPPVLRSGAFLHGSGWGQGWLEAKEVPRRRLGGTGGGASHWPIGINRTSEVL